MNCICIERWIPRERSLVTRALKSTMPWNKSTMPRNMVSSVSLIDIFTRVPVSTTSVFITGKPSLYLDRVPNPTCCRTFYNRVTPIIMQITGHALKCNSIAIDRDNRGNLIETFRWLSRRLRPIIDRFSMPERVKVPTPGPRRLIIVPAADNHRAHSGSIHRRTRGK